MGEFAQTGLIKMERACILVFFTEQAQFLKRYHYVLVAWNQQVYAFVVS